MVLWWREDDGDLIDALVDALTNLAERGFIVLLTPKSGRVGHVDAADIQEAALTAGLHASGGTNAVRDWTGSRLVAPQERPPLTAGRLGAMTSTHQTRTLPAGLGVGEVAPDFTLTDQHGKQVSLSTFRGVKNVVVVFFPFAFSGVCTSELCEIRDDLGAFESDDVEVLAISCDHMFSLRAWADAQGYFFPILSDFWPHGATAQAYGVFRQSVGSAHRGTFLIDRDGVVRWTLVNGPSEKRDFGGYYVALKELTGS